jgi:hypothetical protein
MFGKITSQRKNGKIYQIKFSGGKEMVVKENGKKT